MIFKCFGYVMQCARPIEEEFKRADQNKDGRISMNEFKAYHLKKHGKDPDLRAWMRFHLADEDCNGYLDIRDVYTEDPQKKLF